MHVRPPAFAHELNVLFNLWIIPIYSWPALSAMVRLPLRAPATSGVKVTSIVHDPPAGTVAPHAEVNAKSPEIVIDWVANADNAAKLIAQLHPGKKRLVFVDSRRGVEALGEKLRGAGVDAYVTHSSLSLETGSSV